MESRIWQKLLSIESRDVVSQWFSRLHGKDLNARRAKEITAAAKQAREFFRSSSTASYAVRPLLTFYGVASLSRAVALLNRKDGGEEGLTRGHGLETVSWSDSLSGDTSQALNNVANLRVKTSRGLFQDLVDATNNRLPMHISSAGIDWHLDYPTPQSGHEFALGEILGRLPDLVDQHHHIKRQLLYSNVNSISFTNEDGFKMVVAGQGLEAVRSEFSDAGYEVIDASNRTVSVSAQTKVFESHVPQFVHSYVHKMFGAIPGLYVVPSIAPDIRYSQIAITYILAYSLGMLARYYPTHWTALMSGERGDELWPTINAAHHYVETVFPELMLELIEYSFEKH